MSPRSDALKARLAARTAEVFNARHRLGCRVMYIQRAGAVPIMTSTTGAAFEQAGRSVVFIAHRPDPVETDTLYAPPVECDPATEYTAARGRLVRAALIFLAGAVAALSLALLAPSARAVPPEAIIMMDCDAIPPGDAGTEADEGRAQA